MLGKHRGLVIGVILVVICFGMVWWPAPPQDPVVPKASPLPSVFIVHTPRLQAFHDMHKPPRSPIPGLKTQIQLPGLMKNGATAVPFKEGPIWYSPEPDG